LRFSGRRVLSTLAKLVVSGTVVLLLLRRIGVESVVTELAKTQGGWVGLALAVFALSNLLGAVQWRWFLLSRGVELPFATVVAFYHVGLFFNNFLIGYVGGDVFRIYDAARASGRTAEAASAVFFDRLVGFVALTTMALGASFFLLHAYDVGPALLAMPILLMTLWAVALATLFHSRLAGKLASAGDVLLPRGLRLRLFNLYWQLHAFRHERGLLARAFGLSLVVQTLRVLVHYFTARAVGLNTHLAYFVIFVPIIALVSSLPITFGGIGVREQSAVSLFGQAGVAPGPVTAMEFLAYLVGIACSIPGGIYFLARKEQVKPKPAEATVLS
jgi:uncharacterized protein (TIRG00374 family)